MKNGRAFYGKYASQKTKGWITATMVISIVGAATNLIDFLFGDIISIVSVVFYLAAAFTLLFYKNWMLLLVITIYSLFFPLCCLRVFLLLLDSLMWRRDLLEL